MQTVIETLFLQHDLLLVLLAAVVCALSTFAGMSLLAHARRSRGTARSVWLSIAAVSVGFGIWTTHFVAMLAYHPEVAIGYDIPITLLSLAIAIVIVGGGYWFASVGSRRSDMALAGTVVGMGIGSMHYVGMAAVLVGGAIDWDITLVAASIIIGASLGAAAMLVGTMGQALSCRIKGAALMTLAICAMHFTAMGALGLENCFAVVSDLDSTPRDVALLVGAASLLILLCTFGGLYLDLRERRRAELETDRMRGLADAAVEGLIVCDGLTIVTVNNSFAQLAEASEESLVGRQLDSLLSMEACLRLVENPRVPIEAELRVGRRSLPVEAILRVVDFGGKSHQAVAVRDLSARYEAERHIRYLAHHDALTGLPNRATFSIELDRAIADAEKRGVGFAVLCLDLDRFKEVNDLFGHAAGDALLRKVGASLSDALGSDALAARLGGDEFAVLLRGVTGRERAGAVAESLLDALRGTATDRGGGLSAAASIGIAFYPQSAIESEALMSSADTALYRAKNDGRGMYCFYEAEMGARVRDRRRLENDLRHALSRREMWLVYQPQIDIKSGEVTGFEALVRWSHHERGNVPPSEFIPVAEESGAILQIGEWVLREACAEAARWKSPLTVGVNVSAVQLHHANFGRIVHETLVETGLSPSRLEIEITETSLVSDMVRAVTTLRQIRALGVHIAMDDFGTGYSSLANLRAFPFNKIKVDQSFIKSVDASEQSAAIVRAVLGLGNGLNIPVIAEGVERIEELDFLRGEVCWGAQGYLLSRPQRIAEFRDITDGVTRSIATRDTRRDHLRLQKAS